MELQAVVQTVRERVEPVRSAVAALEAKRIALAETEALISRIQGEVEQSVIAINDAEAAASIQPTPTATKALELACSRNKQATEELVLAHERRSGLYLLIDLEMASLAQQGALISEVNAEFRSLLIAEYARRFEAAWHAFEQVLGDGLALANAGRVDVLRSAIRKNQITHPGSSNLLFFDHELPMKRAALASPNREMIELAVGPVDVELQSLSLAVQHAGRYTRRREDELAGMSSRAATSGNAA
jgi:hypothetical protein